MSKMTRLLKVPNKFQSLFNTWGAGEWKNKPAISRDPPAETGEADGKKKLYNIYSGRWHFIATKKHNSEKN